LAHCDGAPKRFRTELFACDTAPEYAILAQKRDGVNTLLLNFRFPSASTNGSLRPPVEPSNAMNARLDVLNSYLPALSAQGARLDNYCQASRKDLRDAVVAARSACESWANTNAYLRGQILYRAAEMLQNRYRELAQEVQRSTNCSAAQAEQEVLLAIDRLIHFAGWTDKYSQVFGSVNPVASSHFNFTTPEATGVVVVLAPDEPALAPLISLIAPVILSGNAVVLLASDRYPLPAVTFAEILATSDLPAGVVNLLSGRREELAPHIAGHMDVNAVVDGTGLPALATLLQGGTALNLKRYAKHSLAAEEWLGAKAEDPYWILDTIEFKTAWHPIGF
jgi:acyl-CoA reductase-like NAD-dependent aldehyde dehydrogenase